jgi:hypothetical protein
MVSVSGTLLLLYSFGNIFTPGASTALMTRFFPQTLFLLLGSGALLVMLAAAFNLRRRPLSIPPHPLPEIAIPPAGVNQ